MINCIVVGLGGFIGSVLRYLIGLIPLKTDGIFPLKTLAINIIGAFALSLIVAFASKDYSVSPRIVLMLKIGVCGGFTTFSTFAYEATDLFANGKVLFAFTYILLSVALSVIAVFLGQILVK